MQKKTERGRGMGCIQDVMSHVGDGVKTVRCASQAVLGDFENYLREKDKIDWQVEFHELQPHMCMHHK